MADSSTKVSAANAKALADLYKTGSVTNASTGWHSLSFDTAYPIDPVVVVSGIGDNVTCQLKNVSKTGFDYRCLLNGSDSDGLSMSWMAYVLGASSDVVLDAVNQIIGTEYDSIEDLVQNQTDFNKVCSSTDAMNILFVYSPAIVDIATYEPAIDTICVNSTSWAALPGYTALNSAIESSTAGHAKKIYRTWSGSTDTSSIHSMNDVFASSTFPSLCDNSSFLSAMFANDVDLGSIADSAVALHEMCSHSIARQQFNTSQSRLTGFWSRFLASLGNTTYFTQTVSNNPFASNSASNSYYANDQYPTVTYAGFQGDGWKSLTQGPCYVMFDEVANSFGNSLMTTSYHTLIDKTVYPNIDSVKLGEAKSLNNRGPIAGGFRTVLTTDYTNVRVFVAK